MALWVRTQDRFELAKINSVYAGYQEKDKDYVIMGQKHNGGARLGSYATKERALEVLDEIQDILKPKVLVNTYNVEQAEFCDGTQIIKPMIDDVQTHFVSSYVYEMPEK